MGPSLALDFLAMIDARERLPGGAFAILDEADRAILRELLRGYHEQGLTGALERRARTFLISYRELDRHAGVLDAAERERLGQILGEPPPAGAPGWTRPAASDVASARPGRRRLVAVPRAADGGAPLAREVGTRGRGTRHLVGSGLRYPGEPARRDPPTGEHPPAADRSPAVAREQCARDDPFGTYWSGDAGDPGG
ncbi:MAG: hypothetical protein ABSB59_17165 [Streptosporangiaceae bacterium]|jgi:hypothetical protein